MFFESCEANDPVRKRLVRKGILLKKYDSDGIMQRGVYIVNPIIRDFLRMYKPTGKEHFISNTLYPTL
jgi:hypothetical protein